MNMAEIGSGQICVGRRARVMAEIRRKSGMGTDKRKNGMFFI